MLYLIRHAEALGNAQGRVMGQLDHPLTDRGRGQAEALARWLDASGARFAAVYSSDLVRAAETARVVAAACAPGQEVQVRPDLREVGRGAVEGRTFDEAARMRGIPGVAETFEPEERALARLARVGSELRAAASERDVAAVGHGGSLSRLIRFYLGMAVPGPAEGGARLVVRNTGLTLLGFEPHGAVALHGFNLLCHLAPGERTIEPRL